MVCDDAIHRNAIPGLKDFHRCLRMRPKVAFDTKRCCYPLTLCAVSQKRLQSANDIAGRTLLKGEMGPPSGRPFHVNAPTVPLTTRPAPCWKPVTAALRRTPDLGLTVASTRFRRLPERPWAKAIVAWPGFDMISPLSTFQ
jgi:hypothetical protein